MFKVRPFSQTDPQWKNKLLGTDKESTIGKYGCLLTSMTMVADGFGCDETPATLNDKMVSAGGFVEDLIRPAMMATVLSGIKYSKRIQCNNPPAPLAEIDAALAAGMPVIVKVDYSPSPGVQDHWIVIYDKQGKDYLIQDPWPYPVETKPVTLTSRYGFGGMGPERIIKDALWFRGVAQGQPSAPAPKGPPKPLPANALEVYATADGLAMRTQPFVADDNLIKRVPIQTKFLALEPSDQARQKVGQNNQWLEIQDAAAGDQGFAAAWYLSTTKEVPQETPPAPGPGTQPPGSPSGLVVYATEDGLALRMQPVISDETLIKRVPQAAQFIVLEPPAQAQSKLGMQGQWLQVRDVAGDTGYVAAWYLSATQPEPALGPSDVPAKPPSQPASPPAPGKLVVRTTDEGVALRRQPLISDASLVKREPLSAELLVLEPESQAEGKVGIVNQWLNVRDIYGDEGYVAAWYVVKSPLPVAQ